MARLVSLSASLSANGVRDGLVLAYGSVRQTVHRGSRSVTAAAAAAPLARGRAHCAGPDFGALRDDAVLRGPAAGLDRDAMAVDFRRAGATLLCAAVAHIAIACARRNRCRGWPLLQPSRRGLCGN